MRIGCFILCLIISASCGIDKHVEVSIIDSVSSDTSLYATIPISDITYTGTLPCEDCEGINTRLVMRSNGNFTMIEKYIGKQADEDILVTKGVFMQLPDSIINDGRVILQFKMNEDSVLTYYQLVDSHTIILLGDSYKQQTDSKYKLIRSK